MCGGSVVSGLSCAHVCSHRLQTIGLISFDKLYIQFNTLTNATNSCISLSLLSGTKSQNTAHRDRPRHVTHDKKASLTLSPHRSCKH